jgi:MFS transporter, ACS family, solute carrier family 17 (sodium-dependent inorganic phosphate cotransporter), other
LFFFKILQQTYGQWQIVFGILACTYILGSLAFLFFGSGKLQKWNNPPEQGEPEEEGVPLKVKPATISS